MDLNVKQKSVVEVLYKTYKSDTVTRAQINDLVKSKKISMKVYETSEKWYGVTNPGDEEILKTQLALTPGARSITNSRSG